MALTPELQAEIDAYLASVITKVRIPELAPYTTYGELSLLDRSPLWMASVNKTVWVDQQTLRTLLTTGGTGSIVPSIVGDTIIHDVTAAEAGGTSVVIPTLAGKTFFLRREGRAMDTSEYEILNAGGFKLTIPGDVLTEGSRYDLEVYEFKASGSPTTTASAGFLTGVVSVQTNTTLGAAQVNKLVQIRGVGNKVTLTLPDIAQVAANSIIAIEATINNTYQNKIQTSGGQYIYINNGSKNSLFISPGETLWLFCGSDGFYSIAGDVAAAYRNLFKPVASYTVGFDEFECDGSLKNRADLPRIWEELSSLGASLVDDIVWTENDEKKGCFSNGDGSTTFRVPDLRGMALRGLKSSDSLRPFNNPGGYQPDATKVTVPIWTGTGNGGPDGTGTINTGIGYQGASPTPNQFKIKNLTIGTETIMQNVGIRWVMKK